MAVILLLLVLLPLVPLLGLLVRLPLAAWIERMLTAACTTSSAAMHWAGLAGAGLFAAISLLHAVSTSFAICNMAQLRSKQHHRAQQTAPSC
jgi:hypothetical protein